MLLPLPQLLLGRSSVGNSNSHLQEDYTIFKKHFPQATSI